MNVGRQCRRNITGSQKLLCILLLPALFTSFSLMAQVERIYKPRQVIDMGNGRKVEIIRCRGEGPLEECDVISYTTKRQEGIRSWENVNRLREEEQAIVIDKNPQAGIAQSKIAATTTAAQSKQERKSPVNDNVIGAIKEYQVKAGEADVLARKTGSSLNGAAPHVALQNEAKRLDSLSRASADTFKFSLQRELERMDSIEKAAESKPPALKPDSASGRLNSRLYENNVQPLLACQAVLVFKTVSNHTFFDKRSIYSIAVHRSATAGN